MEPNAYFAGPTFVLSGRKRWAAEIVEFSAVDGLYRCPQCGVFHAAISAGTATVGRGPFAAGVSRVYLGRPPWLCMARGVAARLGRVDSFGGFLLVAGVAAALVCLWLRRFGL